MIAHSSTHDLSVPYIDTDSKTKTHSTPKQIKGKLTRSLQATYVHMLHFKSHLRKWQLQGSST